MIKPAAKFSHGYPFFYERRSIKDYHLSRARARRGKQDRRWEGRRGTNGIRDATFLA